MITEKEVKFSGKTVQYLFGAPLRETLSAYGREKLVIITDENIVGFHRQMLEGFRVISITPGEQNKQQPTVDNIIRQLLDLQADRQTVVVGLGGGVVTDIAGYVASIFKRGVRLVQAPTSILAMVDAAIGGKNGVDVGQYKNQVGTIYQPEQVVFDYEFLKSLPESEWRNGFAEIIKHACIKDAAMFNELKQHSLDAYRNRPSLLADIIERNVAIKIDIVINDEFETGDRKLLNFGHTIGHAVEAAYHIPHGQAISIGMVEAGKLSENINGFEAASQQQMISLLETYGLPVQFDYDKKKIWSLLMNDKKRENDQMSFILLSSIGKGIVKNIPLTELHTLIEAL